MPQAELDNEEEAFVPSSGLLSVNTSNLDIDVDVELDAVCGRGPWEGRRWTAGRECLCDGGGVHTSSAKLHLEQYPTAQQHVVGRYSTTCHTA